MRSLALRAHRMMRSAISWKMHLPEGRPMRYMPLGPLKPRRVPCPPESTTAPTCPLAIARSPATATAPSSAPNPFARAVGSTPPSGAHHPNLLDSISRRIRAPVSRHLARVASSASRAEAMWSMGAMSLAMDRLDDPTSSNVRDSIGKSSPLSCITALRGGQATAGRGLEVQPYLRRRRNVGDAWACVIMPLPAEEVPPSRLGR
jgi:hypothetical protein